jgi:hypothetical protein
MIAIIIYGDDGRGIVVVVMVEGCSTSGGTTDRTHAKKDQTLKTMKL